MNIIIPLGGDGVRFKQFEYTQPKPLIKFLGKEIILRVLDSIKLTIREKFSLKFSDSKKINLESKFIKDLPNHLKKYFPKIIKRGNLNYKMKTIHGVDFAKLLKLNLLKNEHLQLMLKTLEIIHKSIPTKLKKHQDKKIYYANYLNKFLSRKRHFDTQIIKV